jgi:hypothetical protein
MDLYLFVKRLGHDGAAEAAVNALALEARGTADKYKRDKARWAEEMEKAFGGVEDEETPVRPEGLKSSTRKSLLRCYR